MDIEKNQTLMAESETFFTTLNELKIPYPETFILTSKAFEEFCLQNKLNVKINHLLETVNPENPHSLMQVSSIIKKEILKSEIPERVTKEILYFYKKLSSVFIEANVDVISRTPSNVISNVKGDSNLLLSIKESWSLFFNPLEIKNRQNQKTDNLKKKYLIIQKKLKAKISGILITNDPSGGDKSSMVLGTSEVLNSSRLSKLFEVGMKLDSFFYFPQEIEWRISSGKIYVLKIKPLTSTTEVKPLNPGIATGKVKIINSPKDEKDFKSKEVAVLSNSKMLSANILKLSSALIMEKKEGISLKEKLDKSGVPAVSDFPNASKILKNNDMITVNGSRGIVYKGGIANNSSSLRQNKSLIKTAAKIFICADHWQNLQTLSLQNTDGLILSLPTDKITAQIVKAAKAFYPRPVIYRLIAENPSILEPELEAVKSARNKENCKNIHLMIPLVRTVKELTEMKKVIASIGLNRSASLKIWMSCDVPANAVLASSFMNQGIDGVSINLNSLTSLLLGIDFDNLLISGSLQLDESVYLILRQIITDTKKHKIESSIYLKGITDEKLIEYLVSLGINSICVSENFLDEARETVLKSEEKLIK